MFKHEQKKALEIKNKDNGNRNLWENINELRGKQTNKKGNVKIYNKEGIELEGDMKAREIKDFWKGIYNKHNNRIEEVWTNMDRKMHKENLDSIRERAV